MALRKECPKIAGEDTAAGPKEEFDIVQEASEESKHALRRNRPLLSAMSDTVAVAAHPKETAMTKKKRWVQNVETVSTFPPEGLFTKDAQTIARVMASKRVSPKGIGSGIRMIQFFINRAGKNLPARQKRELEKAKQILQEKARQKR